MPDNVGYTPGAGSKVAARDVTYSGEAALAQAVGLVTFAGADDAKTATDVSEANPLPVAAYGELIEAVEAMRMAINSLTKTIGYALPNLQGQPIFEARQATAANLNVTASGTVTANQGGTWNITTLTNQSQIGGFAANDEIPALMHLQVDGLRRNISVT
ncbi:MAG: hypothetical protein IM667_07755 [Phenylobacterium sp.]|jgi:hypothetical protein|uniref:hypothetical protein n=1 Tax=Phenylobacterium sp. TaxID=1871053 RepID=UPI0025F34CCC|nr:hypothetical protein [Phenylobacterium sp.]MCA3713014.1 hypothetical protein [Phenylobacterium sp.]MCA3750595.1 hypothetical protein [Phenylobacterium sp.]MCA6236817.1 hypothetical protein [Phenylobacterium sp.]MCA6240515.1 hypothetical protein [Phenylobacterium sp.]